MSKKHFIALAEMIIGYNEILPAGIPQHMFCSGQISALADFCQAQNPNFNRERWLAYIAGECGPNGGPVKPNRASAR